jgi:hypothetical protein
MDNIEEADVDVDVQEPDTLSAALSAAWDDAEEEIDDGSIDTRSEGSAEDDKHIESSDTKADGTAVPEQGEPLHKLGDGSNTDAEVAPKSLPPAAREAWGKTPKAMRDAIATREKQYEDGIMKYSQGAKQAQQMQQTFQPFQQYTSMNGGPKQAITGLLQTGSMLQMGSPQQKAEIVANIIGQFGVDISTLDNMLVGNAPSQEVQQNSQMEQMLNQRLQPLQQQLGVYQQRDQQQANNRQTEIGNELHQFANDPANEFYNDVSGRMADELDMAVQNGTKLDLKGAYELAVRSNPEIFKLVQSRANAKSLGSKRTAATSIHGTPQGGGGGKANPSVRSAIEDAWDNAGQL